MVRRSTCALLALTAPILCSCGNGASSPADAGADASLPASDALEPSDAAESPASPDANPDCLKRCDFPVVLDLDESGRAYFDYHHDQTPPCTGGAGDDSEAVSFVDRIAKDGVFSAGSQTWTFRDGGDYDHLACTLDQDADALICAGSEAGALVTLSLSRNVYEMLDLDIRLDHAARQVAVEAACYQRIPAASAR